MPSAADADLAVVAPHHAAAIAAITIIAVAAVIAIVAVVPAIVAIAARVGAAMMTAVVAVLRSTSGTTIEAGPPSMIAPVVASGTTIIVMAVAAWPLCVGGRRHAQAGDDEAGGSDHARKLHGSILLTR
jgi:hypothetical protein